MIPAIKDKRRVLILSMRCGDIRIGKINMGTKINISFSTTLLRLKSKINAIACIKKYEIRGSATGSLDLKSFRLFLKLVIQPISPKNMVNASGYSDQLLGNGIKKRVRASV